MVQGAPDFTKMVALYGTDGTQLRLVKLDADGQLYALLMGDFSGTPTAISVTTDGELYAVLKAAFGGVLKDVAADTNGNLTLNLKAQDLAEVINRPRYGDANIAAGVNVSCGVGVDKQLVSVSGQGMIYGGQLFIDAAWEGGDTVEVEIDGASMQHKSIDDYWGDDFTDPRLGYLHIKRYDTITPRLVMGIPYGMTFETGIKIRFNAKVSTRTVTCHLIHAIV